MLRLLRLYACFVRFSLSKAMEFRLDFFFRIVMDCAFYAVQLGFFTILYRHTAVIGGWDLDQIYLFVGGLLFADALQMTVFANNLWWLPIFINRGDLDYYLVRPVSPLFILSLRELAANSAVNLLLATGILAWAVGRYEPALGPLTIVAFVAWLVLGTVIWYEVRMIFIIPVFWLHSSRGLDEISWSLHRLSERPHQIYQPWLRWTVLTVLPLAFVFSVPAHVAFGGLSWTRFAHTLAVVAGVGLAMGAFWRRGLRAYASASS